MGFHLSAEPWNLLVRVLVAAAFGGVLGLERDMHGRAAGLRTHLLVSTGAALFMILSTHVSTFGVVFSPGFNLQTDPGRIAAQVVTGIGFLGAGVIIKEGISVRGLTTAACLWIAAAIGMTSGAGLYIIAGATTLVALFALVVLRRLEVLYKRDIYRDLEITVPNEVKIDRLIETVKDREVMIISLSLDRDYEAQTTTAYMALRLFHRGNGDKLVHRIMEKLEAGQIPLKAVKWSKP